LGNGGRNVIFFFLLLGSVFGALVLQHFIAPLPPFGVRILLMPLVVIYGSLALPLPGMLALTFFSGLMWDILNTQVTETGFEVAPGWSVILYAALGALMSGLRPLFQRGRWEVHCLLGGVCTALTVLAEYLMLSIRRQPVSFVFNELVWWRVAGSGVAAAVLAPVTFYFFNYIAGLVGYDPLAQGRKED
jgi:hypothetical protein